MADLTAKDVMSRDVVVVQDDATLEEVVDLLTGRGISGAPVVDVHGDVVGVISESDLLDPDKRRGALPRTALFGVTVVNEDLLMKAYEGGKKLKARNLMTPDPVCASEDTPVEQLRRWLVSRRINRIPIVRDGKPVGIVTRDDLLKL